MPSFAAQSDPLPFPAAKPGLEEAGASAPGDWPQAMAFSLHRALGDKDEGRPLLFVATKAWVAERGSLSARGLAHLGIEPERMLVMRADKAIDALWALEEGLKSGALAGAVGAVETAAFVATRRLDFAARAGRAVAVLLRTHGGEDLSVARLRWQVAATSSAADPYDRLSPGAPRLTASLTRRRDGPLGAWMLEQDDETHRLRLVAGLADHGMVQGDRTHAAA